MPDVWRLVVAFLLAVPLVSAAKVEERLEQCSTVLEELLNVPDGIPRDLLDKAECESGTAQDLSS